MMNLTVNSNLFSPVSVDIEGLDQMIDRGMFFFIFVISALSKRYQRKQYSLFHMLDNDYFLK